MMGIDNDIVVYLLVAIMWGLVLYSLIRDDFKHRK